MIVLLLKVLTGTEAGDLMKLPRWDHEFEWIEWILIAWALGVILPILAAALKLLLP